MMMQASFSSASTSCTAQHRPCWNGLGTCRCSMSLPYCAGCGRLSRAQGGCENQHVRPTGAHRAELQRAGPQLHQPGHCAGLPGRVGQAAHEQHAPLLGRRQGGVHHRPHQLRGAQPRGLLQDLRSVPCISSASSMRHFRERVLWRSSPAARALWCSAPWPAPGSAQRALRISCRPARNTNTIHANT